MFLRRRIFKGYPTRSAEWPDLPLKGRYHCSKPVRSSLPFRGGAGNAGGGGFDRQRERSDVYFPSNHAFRGFHHVLGRDLEQFEQGLFGRRFAETVDTDDGTGPADVFVPAACAAGLDGDRRDI